MAIQFSSALRSARLDALETHITGTTGTTKFRIYTGSMPANAAATATGTLLVDMTLAADFMDNASAGAKGITGAWSGVASAGGTAGYFRIVTDNGGSITTHLQGVISATGGGGDLVLTSTSVSNGQTVSITSFTITDGNA